MAHLRSVTNPKEIHAITTRDNEFVVGRNPDCDLVINATSISRRHAVFTFDGTHHYLQDLHSRNSTYLNGVKIDPNGRPHPLKDNDKVGFCDLEYVFRAADAPSPEGGIFFVDDDVESSESTIMSKVGVLSGQGGVQVTASPQAKLNALLEINRSLGRALSLDEVLPQVLSSLFKIFVQADRGFVALRNADGTLVPRWSHTWREDATETIRVSRTIVNKVMETQEAILSADAMNDEEFNKAHSIAEFRIRSMMCAPLLDNLGNSIGVLQIDTARQSKRFQPEDLEVLSAVASRVSIAIDNAQMHELALRQRSLERDLELAREVQHGFLPDTRPGVPGYEFFDFYQPALHVGGDYFDYISLPDGRVAVIVADVVGKGVAAALLMAKLSAEARFSLVMGGNAARAVSLLNERMCALHLDRFITAVLLLLDPHTHEVSIANAGHMAPIWRTKNGRIAEPGQAEAGLPLGIDESLQYAEARVSLAVGESLTMFTDGVNEAASASGEYFTIDRIRRCVEAASGPPSVIGNAVIQDVHNFIGDGLQSDDMCLVTFGRVG